MKSYTAEELKEILAKHKLWRDDEEGGERAYLRDAYLRGANLSGADLGYAYLGGAYLGGANLGGTVGELRHLKSIFLEIWPITYTDEVLQIGCQRHPIADWWDFSDRQISAMDCQASDWWAKWKDHLKKTIELSPAEPTGYVEKSEDAA